MRPPSWLQLQEPGGISQGGLDFGHCCLHPSLHIPSFTDLSSGRERQFGVPFKGAEQCWKSFIHHQNVNNSNFCCWIRNQSSGVRTLAAFWIFLVVSVGFYFSGTCQKRNYCYSRWELGMSVCVCVYMHWCRPVMWQFSSSYCELPPSPPPKDISVCISV